MRHLRPVVSSALVALGLAAVVPTTVAAAAPARESRAAAAVECIGEYVFDLAPGLSTTPSSGTSFSARPGRLRCSDGRTGTIAFAGRYGTAGPADCTSGGEGWGVWEFRMKGERRPVRDTLTYEFGKLAKGSVTGTFDSDLMTGTLTALPVRGDCLTTPVTQGRVRVVGTMKK